MNDLVVQNSNSGMNSNLDSSNTHQPSIDGLGAALHFGAGATFSVWVQGYSADFLSTSIIQPTAQRAYRGTVLSFFFSTYISIWKNTESVENGEISFEKACTNVAVDTAVGAVVYTGGLIVVGSGL